MPSSEAGAETDNVHPSNDVKDGNSSSHWARKISAPFSSQSFITNPSYLEGDEPP